MPLDMVRRDEWFAQSQRETFCRRRPDEQRAGQTRSACRCTHVDIGQTYTRLLQSGFGHFAHVDQMVARSHLRHHTAIGCMHVGLRGDDMTKQLARKT